MTRFSDFQRSLGVAPNILAARLDRFVDAGLMERHPGPIYRLTAMGRDLQPVLIALTAWGDTWAAPAGPPIQYTHHACGGQVHLCTHCTQCGQVPDTAEVIAV